MPGAMSGQAFQQISRRFQVFLCIESFSEQHEGEQVSPIPATRHGARQASGTAMHGFDQTN